MKSSPVSPAASWTAYSTVIEHGHQSRVTAGENAGEPLQALSLACG